MEEKGEKPKVSITFEDARPSLTHMALVGLERAGDSLTSVLPAAKAFM